MKIRALNKNELELIFLYTKLEGWDVEDIHLNALYKTNPKDFFIAFEDEELVGFILALKHSSNFGIISTFLVLKKFRSLGFGKALFQHALQHLNEFQIALDSVSGYEKFYEKFGFKKYFDVYTYKYQLNSSKTELQDIKTYDFDVQTSLIDKTEYQTFILQNKGIKYKEIKSNSKINSFAYAFKYIDGYKITIETESMDEAISLFFALTNELRDKEVIYLEVNLLSVLLVNLAKTLNMSLHSKSSRMYNKIIK